MTQRFSELIFPTLKIRGLPGVLGVYY